MTHSPSRRPIRVLLVDDSDIVRMALLTALYADESIDLVGEARDGQEGVALFQQLQPDVVLMDLVMPVMDGVEATRAIRQGCPRARIIALSSFSDEHLVRDVLAAGAMSYLLKTVSASDILAAIHAAHADQPTLHPDIAKIARTSGPSSPTSSGPADPDHPLQGP